MAKEGVFEGETTLGTAAEDGVVDERELAIEQAKMVVEAATTGGVVVDGEMLMGLDEAAVGAAAVGGVVEEVGAKTVVEVISVEKAFMTVNESEVEGPVHSVAENGVIEEYPSAAEESGSAAATTTTFAKVVTLQKTQTLADKTHDKGVVSAPEQFAQSPDAKNSLDLFLMPSVSLVCCLVALYILSIYNLVFLLSTATLVVISLFVTTMTVCHIYQIVAFKPIANPCQSCLDSDLNTIFSAVTPLLSRALFVGFGFCENLRRAYLFRDLFKSLKLILVVCVLYRVGHLFTVSRSVIALHLYLILSQPEIKVAISYFLRRSPFCSRVFRRFF